MPASDQSREDNDLRAAKAALRRRARALLREITPEQRRIGSAAASARLAAEPFWRKAQAVLVFLSMPSEIDTAGLVRAALADGKRLAVPRCDSAGVMSAVVIRSLDGLAPGTLGILEPPAGAPALPPSELDVVVAPGLAFDAAGRRIGRGAGYYDRFLATPGVRAFVCGFGFERQVVPRVPVGTLDRPLDALVTEEHTRLFGRV
jgi:5-formyltetrahydrofolate cyclo-ligase